MPNYKQRNPMLTLYPKKAAAEGMSPGWVRQREKILTVSGRLFWQKGYLGTSISDIASAAKVNKATIYYYFKSKAVILYEIVSRAAQEFRELLMAVVNADLPPIRKLELLINGMIKWETSHSGLAGLGQREKGDLPPKLLRDYIKQRDEIEGVFRKLIAEVIAEGEFQHQNPKIISLFILGLLNSIIQWYRPNGELSTDGISKIAFEFVTGALRISEP